MTRLGPAELEDFRDGYVDVVDSILRQGREASPRGYKTWEVRGASFQVNDVHALLPYGVGRNLKPEIGYAEALLLCSGLGSPSLLTSVSPAFRRFMDGGQLAGAYGPRVRHQMEHVVRSLASDPDTRQAVAMVYDPRHDQLPVRDVACTVYFNFHLRGGQLHMQSRMRSQDVWLGAAYDLFMFGQLGHTVAHALGTSLATLQHQADSLHLYERNADAAEGLHAFDGRQCAEPDGFGWDTHQWRSYEQLRLRAEAVYNCRKPEYPTASELLYLETLAGYDRDTQVENFRA